MNPCRNRQTISLSSIVNALIFYFVNVKTLKTVITASASIWLEWKLFFHLPVQYVTVTLAATLKQNNFRLCFLSNIAPFSSKLCLLVIVSI